MIAPSTCKGHGKARGIPKGKIGVLLNKIMDPRRGQGGTAPLKPKIPLHIYEQYPVMPSSLISF